MTDQARAGNGAGDVRNSAEIGIAVGAFVQGRDISLTLPARVTPAMAGLPPVSPVFVGRAAEVESLAAELAPTAERRPVITLTGLAGIGKTELMLHVADDALARPGWFPGGVLYVDLQGYDPARHVTPDQALRRLLRALAVPTEHLSGDTEYQAALLRSILSAYAKQGRRVLLLLDNASSSDDVSRLLPSDGSTATIITSRDELGLKGRRHQVEDLDDAAGLSLLDTALNLAHPGDSRLGKNPEQAASIVCMGAGHPLTLAIVAGMLVEFPTRPLVSLFEELKGLVTGGVPGSTPHLPERAQAVRAAFELSYRRLSAEQQRLFCLLPLHTGPEIPTEALAAMAQLPTADTQSLLEDLARANLVRPTNRWGRWTLHDLVRLYADGKSRERFSDAERLELVRLLLTHYQDGVAAAYSLPVTRMAEARDKALPQTAANKPRLLSAAMYLTDSYLAAAITAAEQNVPTPPGLAPAASSFAMWSEAQDWFGIESSNLMAARRQAAELRQHGAAFLLGACLVRLLKLEQRLPEASAIAASTLGSARLLEDRRPEAWALNNYAVTMATGITDDKAAEALPFHDQARALYEQLGDRPGLAWTLNGHAIDLRRAGHVDEALAGHRRACDLYEELGDPTGRAWALNSLAITLRRAGRAHEAVALHKQAIALYADNPSGLGWAELSSQISEAKQTWDLALEAWSAWRQRRRTSG